MVLHRPVELAHVIGQLPPPIFRLSSTWWLNGMQCAQTVDTIIAARMSTNPPNKLYLKAELAHQTYCEKQVTAPRIFVSWTEKT